METYYPYLFFNGYIEPSNRTALLCLDRRKEVEEGSFLFDLNKKESTLWF